MEKTYFKNAFNNTFGEMMGTPIGRAMWVNLVTPNAKFKPEKFGLTILFDKKDPACKTQLNQMIAACKDIATSVYGAKVPAFTYPPIRDGDENEKYKNFKGMYYIGAKSKNRIEVIDAKKNTLDAAIVAPGVLVRAVVTPILFDSGFAWQLNAVQFVKDDGVRFYGGADPKSLFDELQEEDQPAAESAAEPAAESTSAEAADKALGPVAKKTGKQQALAML